MSQKNGQTVRRARPSRQRHHRVSRAKGDGAPAGLQRGVRPGPGCGAAARARGVREEARRAHIQDTVRRARVSRSPPPRPASLRPSGSQPTPCTDSRGMRWDPPARLARPSQRPNPHPSPTAGSSRTMPRARAGPPSPTTTRCRCVERRSPLAPPRRVFFSLLLADSRNFPPPVSR